MKQILTLIIATLLPTALLPSAEAEKPAIELGAPFSDSAILQRGMPVPVWGWSTPGDKITVAFAGQKKTTEAGKDGKWMTKLDPLEASAEPREMTITLGSGKSRTLKDILIGEVWLCSGQSNIAGKVKHNSTGKGGGDNLAQARILTIRQFRSDIGWRLAMPGDVLEFTRVGFCFARELQRELKVPVGLLSASVGGTSIESWIHTDAPLDPAVAHQPGGNYLKHIQPLVGCAMRGALWYQGEANLKDGFGYLSKLKNLIEGWRSVWQQGDYPFLVVQLASIGESVPGDAAMGENRAHIREAQLQVLRQIPHTGLAAAIDTGALKEHPPNKFETSFRLAQWALHHQYGRQNIVPSGPLYRDSKVEGGAVRVRFDNANGLMIANKLDYEMPVAAPGAKLPWLSIQSKDGSWHWADARIAGTDLLVSSPEVAEPVAVRYAWVNRPLGPYLYNAAGLPAFPFSTEPWQP